MNQRWALGTPIMIMLSGCASAITLQPAQKTVEPGHEVVVVFQNGSLYTAWGNLCTATLERECGRTWTAVPNRENGERVCVLVLDRYPRGYRSELRVRLDADSPSGTYRVTTRIEVSGKPLLLTSDPFFVSPLGSDATSEATCQGASQPGVAAAERDGRSAPSRSRR